MKVPSTKFYRKSSVTILLKYMTIHCIIIILLEQKTFLHFDFILQIALLIHCSLHWHSIALHCHCTLKNSNMQVFVERAMTYLGLLIPTRYTRQATSNHHH